MNQDILKKRLPFTGAALVMLAGMLIFRLVSLQFGSIDDAYFRALAEDEYNATREIYPPRGSIYDRNGVLLATNTLEYEVGVSPVFVVDREGTAIQLAAATGLPHDDILERISTQDPGVQYVQIMRPAPPEVGQHLIELDLSGVVVSPMERRIYPHGPLAAHVLGFVSGDETGYYGVEGFYNSELRGQPIIGNISQIPFRVRRNSSPGSSVDMMLTLDSEIQFLAETTLASALESTGAESGTIIVLDPRTGEILAMANLPTFDPNDYGGVGEELHVNPAVSSQFEPGSIFKVVTMAVALDTGTVAPDSTYVDNGIINVGGQDIYNWDRATHGVTSMTDLLAKSLNVGTSTLSVTMGPTRFYGGLENFGLGEPTGVDLQGEAAGALRQPGDPAWHESDLGTNSFGQGLATTPLQMTVAVGAVANRGLMMQPHIVSQRLDANGEWVVAQPSALQRVVSTETALNLSEMLAQAIEREASEALVPGYRIAGKTGTAEIPLPGGYDPVFTIGTFVGFGPVDDPQFVVLIKLDRPTTSRWGSQTAAPVFSAFVQRLVVLMEIPPDDVRHAVAANQ